MQIKKQIVLIIIYWIIYNLDDGLNKKDFRVLLIFIVYFEILVQNFFIHFQNIILLIT